MNAGVVQRQAGGHKQLQIVKYLGLQFAMVYGGSEAMQVRHKQIDLILLGVLFGHINYWQKRAEIIANMKIVIGPDTS